MSKIVFIVIRIFWLSSFLAGLSLPLLFPVTLQAFDERLTHPQLTRVAVRSSIADSFLKEELDMAAGIDTRLKSSPGVEQAIRLWLEEGARLEDEPACRARNHFHNPLLPFVGSGVSDQPFFIRAACFFSEFSQVVSNVTWATGFMSPSDKGPATGNRFDWDTARISYLNALTLPARADRETALAQTFETLGHVMHLVQDMAVPAHVRNDFQSHLEYCFTSFERWCENSFERFVRRRADLVANAVPLAVDFAGQRLTRFWDVDQYTGTNPSADLTQGLAEYTNANFASLNTIFTESLDRNDPHAFPYPRESSTNLPDLFAQRLVLREVTAEDGVVDMGLYVSKTGDGETIEHFAKVGYLASFVLDRPDLPPVLRLTFQLDDRVHEDYATLLLPKAIGYSKALLDYFFRGKLDVDLFSADANDQSIVQVSGTNASADTLDGGTLTLYADDPKGVRSPVTALDPNLTVTAAAGAPVVSARFQAPENAERFIAVYQGKLGQEAPAGTFPGGVIGKVLGGVRVEEVFAAGEEWKLRTPKGVFRLEPPLRVAEYEQVKWGDGPNLLVARTAFGPGQPNRVDAFEVPRVPNSVDLATVDTPDGPKVSVTRTRSAVLPAEGIPTGTTVNFHQTWSYRQQMVRVQEITITVPCVDGQPVGPATVTATPPQLETLTITNADFPLTFHIILDAGHHQSSNPRNYAWLLIDVGADPSGRLVGLVLVFGESLDIPTVPITTYVINRTTGAPVEFARSFLSASYPPGGDPLLWALVDLSEGRVITSTAEPTMTISYHKVSEGSPLLWPNGAVGVAAHTTLVSCETTDSGWVITHVDRRSLPAGTVPVVTLRVDERIGEEGLITNGLLRGDLKSALASTGFVDPQVSTGEFAEQVTYICLQSDPVGDCQAVEVDSRFIGVSPLPAFLADARRPSAATGGERLVLLAATDTALGTPLAAVAVMESNPLRSQVRYQPRAEFPRLSGVTTTRALVTEEEDFNTLVSTTLVSLDGSRPPVVFPDVDLSESFRVLEPSYLYDVTDLKFYRLQPPLQRTALPAKLADLPDGSNPVGDYHAIRVP